MEKDNATTRPNPPSFARSHTFQAARLLFRPGEMDSSSYPNVVADLLDDILSDRIDLKALDVDGSTVVSLALQKWGRWPRNLVGKTNIPPGFSGYPLPEEDGRHHDPRYVHDWQQPAAALIWKGADPFQQWPHDDHVAWSRKDWDRRIPKCGVLAAIRYKAWTIVELCLRHPDCPPPEEFDKLRIHGNDGLLHAAARGNGGLEILLDYGLDPNVVDSQGRTPLFVVKQPEDLVALLKAGAHPGHKDNDGNDAPTYWVKTHQDPGPLIEAWNRHSSGPVENPNGRMVVQAIQTKSWKTMKAALKASGWAPDQPVDSNQHPTRRLPEEVVILLLSSLITHDGKALPITSLSKLVSEPGLRDIWTPREKAWMACALLLIDNSERVGFAFSERSMDKLRVLLKELLEMPGVGEQIATAFGEIMEGVREHTKGAFDRYVDGMLWNSWLDALPLTELGPHVPDLKNPDINGINSLKLLSSESESLLGYLGREKNIPKIMDGVALVGFQGASREALEGYVRMRALALPHQGEAYRQLDQSWREAWDMLPGGPKFCDAKIRMGASLPKAGQEDGENLWSQEWGAWLQKHEMGSTLPAPKVGPPRQGRF